MKSSRIALKSIGRKFSFMRQKPRFTRDYPKYTRYEIGDWTYGKPRVLDWGNGATLRIGRYCSIAAEVVILLNAEHRPDWVTTYPFIGLWDEVKKVHGHPATKGDVEIGNDVWIGYGTTIMSGVKIGNGAVLGARAVVTKDIEPYAIVGGNPAKPIRKRFSDAIIERLQEIAWWDWPREKVIESMPLLLSSNIESFVDRYGGVAIDPQILTRGGPG